MVSTRDSASGHADCVRQPCRHTLCTALSGFVRTKVIRWRCGRTDVSSVRGCDAARPAYGAAGDVVLGSLQASGLRRAARGRERRDRSEGGRQGRCAGRARPQRVRQPRDGVASCLPPSPRAPGRVGPQRSAQGPEGGHDGPVTGQPGRGVVTTKTPIEVGDPACWCRRRMKATDPGPPDIDGRNVVIARIACCDDADEILPARVGNRGEHDGVDPAQPASVFTRRFSRNHDQPSASVDAQPPIRAPLSTPTPDCA